MRLDFPEWNKAKPTIRLLKQFPNGVLVDYEVDHAADHRRPPRVVCVSGINLGTIGSANDDEPGQLQGP